MRRAHLLPLRARHVWIFVLVSSLVAGSLPAGRGRYVATLLVCALGIAGFCLTMIPARAQEKHRPRMDAGNHCTPASAAAADHHPASAVAPSGGTTVRSSDPNGMLVVPNLTGSASVEMPAFVDTASADQLLRLVGEQVTGADGQGVQLWATPVDDDGLDVEFIDATGAHACIRLVAQGFVVDDVE